MNELTDYQKYKTAQIAYYESVSEYQTKEYQKQNGYHESSQFDTNPNLEKDISLNSQYSFLYARNILKAPFPLAEPIIADSVYYLDYSIYVLKSRFKLAENKIRHYHNYTKHILKINHE